MPRRVRGSGEKLGLRVTFSNIGGDFTSWADVGGVNERKPAARGVPITIAQPQLFRNFAPRIVTGFCIIITTNAAFAREL
jgi:hypothetical protein